MEKLSKKVTIGDITIGGGNPIAIQSMLNIPLTRIDEAVDQALRLKDAGCDIIRFAVPDMEAAGNIKEFISRTKMNTVADIHFDYRLAIAAIDAGVHKVRINPGNIGSRDRIKLVAEHLKSHQIPVRIGVNSGSIRKDILEKYHHPCPEAFLESATESIEAFTEFGLEDIVISIKSSDVVDTYKANLLFREHFDNPLHLGVTEAGSELGGVVRSSVGIGSLLLNGVGDTIRVSLTDDPVEEIYAAKEILRACGLRNEGVRIVSCPTCGRTQTNIMPIVRQIKEKTKNIKTPVTLAVMGCVVNGPGEAREADLGVACGKDEGLIFIKGETIEKVSGDRLTSRLLEELEKIIKEKESK